MPTLRQDYQTFKPSGAKTGWFELFGTVSTTDATTTQIAAVPVAELQGVHFVATLHGVQSDYSDQIVVNIEGGARRAAAGNVTLTGTTAVRILESSASTNATVTADTTNQTVDFNVVGIAAENWRWEIKIEYHYM